MYSIHLHLVIWLNKKNTIVQTFHKCYNGKRLTKERGKVLRPEKMKNKILSVVLAATLISTSAMPTFATPNEEVIANQQEYTRMTEEINEIEAKVMAYNVEIEPLIETVEKNSARMEEIKVTVSNTEKEIQATKEEMEETKTILGKRIRELYKSGGQNSYLTVLFSAKSFNDLISKLDATRRLINIDNEIVDGLDKQQLVLDEKINSLEKDSVELATINEETQKKVNELDVKKKEQEVLIEEAEAKQKKFEVEFLAISERKLVESQFAVIDKSSSSLDALKSAVSQLKSIRDGQIMSSTVKDEINKYITSAQNKINKKEEELQAEEDEANRGDVSASTSSIVNYAYKFIGVPYVWGGTTPSGFDCSGFTSYVYRHAAGIEISRTTYTQMTKGKAVSYSQLQPGDLVFTYGGGHVGIYVGGGKYIHAPKPGDRVKVAPIYGFYSARRIL